MLRLFKLNSQGQALIQAILTSSVVVLIGLGIVNLSSDLHSQNALLKVKQNASAAAMLIGSVTMSTSVCPATIRKGAGGASTVAANAITNVGQNLEICIPHYTADGVCDAGDATEWYPNSTTTLADTNMRIRSITLHQTPANPVQVIGPITEVVGELRVSMDYLGSNAVVPLSSQVAVSQSRIIFNNEVVTGCSATSSAQQICEQLNGKYDATQTPSCIFGLPNMTCPGAHDVIVAVQTNSNGVTTPVCQSVRSSCPYGEVAISLSGRQLECRAITDWDFSNWSACAGGTSTREVRCVASARMRKWMVDNGHQTYQPTVPSGIVVADSACTSPKPATTATCNAGCTIAAGTSWTDTSTTLNCFTSASINIAEGASLTVTDAVAPNTGSATYACSSGSVTLQAGATCISTGCPRTTVGPTFVSFADDAASNAKCEAIYNGVGSWCTTPAESGDVAKCLDAGGGICNSSGCSDGFIYTCGCTNLACGSSNGGTFANAPTTNLCTDGSAPTVTSGSSDYTWACGGASCSANKAATCGAGKLYGWTITCANSTCTLAYINSFTNVSGGTSPPPTCDASRFNHLYLQSGSGTGYTGMGQGGGGGVAGYICDCRTQKWALTISSYIGSTFAGPYTFSTGCNSYLMTQPYCTATQIVGNDCGSSTGLEPACKFTPSPGNCQLRVCDRVP